MKALVVYDSVYGNTETIAKAIGGALAGEVRVARVGEIDAAQLERVDVLLIGSPTLGGRPSEPLQQFLDKLPESAVKDVRIAAFDTRYSGKFVKIFGFASEKIAAALQAKGGKVAEPLGAFIVKGKKGPLQDGEVERAVNWAIQVTK